MLAKAVVIVQTSATDTYDSIEFAAMLTTERIILLFDQYETKSMHI